MTHLISFFAIAFCYVSIAFAEVAPQGDARFDEGQNRAAAGDIAGALAVYESLTQTYPDSFEAHARLGGMQLMDQRYAAAVKSFQRAIMHGDTGTRSFIGMGMAYLHMGQLGPARAAFVEAQTRGPDERADIAEIIAWIDSRERAPTTHLPPQ